mgnify:CR=1 FL=1
MCRQQGTAQRFQNGPSLKSRCLRAARHLRRGPAQRREDVHVREGRNVHAEDVGRERFLEAGRTIPVPKDVPRVRGGVRRQAKNPEGKAVSPLRKAEDNLATIDAVAINESTEDDEETMREDVEEEQGDDYEAQQPRLESS